jgi:hypothetical protein
MLCYGPEHLPMAIAASGALWAYVLVGALLPCYWQARFPSLDVVYHPRPLVAATLLRLLVIAAGVFLHTQPQARLAVLLVLASALAALTVLARPCLVWVINAWRVALYAAVIASAAWSLAFTAAAAIAPEVFMGVLGAIWALALAACVGLGVVAARLDRPRLSSEVSSTTAVPTISIETVAQ